MQVSDKVLTREKLYILQYHQDIYKRDYIELYVNIIGQIVAKEDDSRPYVTSSPSNGKKSVSEGYLSGHPQDNRYGDVHFYYYGDDAIRPSAGYRQ